MDSLSRALREVRREFAVPAAAFNRVADAFQADLAAGLAGAASSLPLLPTYVTNPSGREQGCCLAVDMGGTNVRVLLVELLGDGALQVRRQVRRRLSDFVRGYDCTAPAMTPEALFAFLARLVGEVAPAGGRYPLGFTFSYPCRQSGRTQAVLLRWNKEIRIPGVEGCEVGVLLEEALAREQVRQVELKAIVNDTVGTQLAGAYHDRACRTGVIISTGFNACYLENRFFPPPGQIVNLEAGDFAGLAPNSYDRQLDAASSNPGGQRLEKMVAGLYLGELVRLTAGDLAQQGLLWHGAVPAAFNQPYVITGEDLGRILADVAPGQPVTADLLRRWGVVDSAPAERAALRQICSIVTARSARLVAAVLCGLLRYSDPHLAQRHVIAVDGALYGRMPGYARSLSLLLNRALGAAAHRVVIRLTPDGSGIGAAIAAALEQ